MNSETFLSKCTVILVIILYGAKTFVVTFVTVFSPFIIPFFNLRYWCEQIYLSDQIYSIYFILSCYTFYITHSLPLPLRITHVCLSQQDYLVTKLLIDRRNDCAISINIYWYLHRRLISIKKSCRWKRSFLFSFIFPRNSRIQIHNIDILA